MKFKIFPRLLFRSPKFPFEKDLKSCWEELKIAISISSKPFYQIIKDVSSEELSTLSPKVLFTIWKYFNRSKFRGTPYGTFAGFSTLNIVNTTTEMQKISVDEDFVLHEFIDWPIKNDIQIDFNDLIESNGKLQSNNSWYKILESIRYIACSNAQFELAEIEYDEFVVKILNATKYAIKITDLVEVLSIKLEELDAFYSFLRDMHEVQLLITSNDPNIIGEDYFERLNINFNPDTPKYIIAERKIIESDFSTKHHKEILQLIQKLHQLTPPTEQKSLENFKLKFQAKFEQREVPLLRVLDPELGIGYDNLEQGGDGNDFIGAFIGKTKKQNTDALKNSLSKPFYQAKSSFSTSIDLNQLEEVKGFNQDQKLPNSISVLYSIIDDQIVVDQIGGSSANAINGRFTLASDDVFDLTKEIAKIEAQANPDVLFFEIGYMVENTIDNVNRRKLIYDYQLSILNFNTAQNAITLDDILLSVIEDEVILRSKKYNKRLVPRIASAYNYIRSDLSLFRLFCDVQSQNLQTGLGISLDEIFPNEIHYPQLKYKNIILSLAKWKISVQDLFVQKTSTIEVKQCAQFLMELGVSRYFKTGLSDQTLTFDLHNEEDIKAFLFYIQNKKELWLEEVLLPKNAWVKNTKGQGYLAQFVLSAYHQEEIYPGVFDANVEALKAPIQANFPPGSQWLYFEIYCHEQRTDYLLISVIKQYLEQHQEHIKSWFFIRYNENGEHLRLRILLKDQKQGFSLISNFSEKVEPYLSSGVISNVILKNYKREVERYSNDLMEEAELVFAESSILVISCVENSFDEEEKYKTCANLVFDLIRKEVFTFEEILLTIKRISNSFNEEHKLEQEEFKKLNSQYQLFKQKSLREFELDTAEKYAAYSNSFQNILVKCALEQRISLFGSLMHMHVNRLFNKNQRTHEMVMYYFLYKDLQRLRATKN